MPRTKNNFLNAKPVSKMGGKSGGVRKPGKPYSKPPAKPKSEKPARWDAKTKTERLQEAAKTKAKSSAPKQVIKTPVTRTGPVKGPVPPKGNSAVSMPNSRRAGVNLPKTGARAERTAARVADLKKPATSKSTPKPTKAPGLLGKAGRALAPIQFGIMGAELATQAGYARGGKNYKEFVRAQDRVPAKPAAKPAAKPGKPALSSTGVRVSDKAHQRDYKAAPTGSKQYNDFRNRQIAGERERLKNVGNPSKPKPKPPAPVADQRRSSGGGNNTAPRSQTPPKPRFTGTVDEGRQKWAEKYSSSKYDGQAIQKEAKKLLDEMKKRREDKSNATKAGWDGNKNY